MESWAGGPGTLRDKIEGGWGQPSSWVPVLLTHSIVKNPTVRCHFYPNCKDGETKAQGLAGSGFEHLAPEPTLHGSSSDD